MNFRKQLVVSPCREKVRGGEELKGRVRDRDDNRVRTRVGETSAAVQLLLWSGRIEERWGEYRRTSSKILTMRHLLRVHRSLVIYKGVPLFVFTEP